MDPRRRRLPESRSEEGDARGGDDTAVEGAHAVRGSGRSRSTRPAGLRATRSCPRRFPRIGTESRNVPGPRRAGRSFPFQGARTTNSLPRLSIARSKPRSIRGISSRIDSGGLHTPSCDSRRALSPPASAEISHIAPSGVIDAAGFEQPSHTTTGSDSPPLRNVEYRIWLLQLCWFPRRSGIGTRKRRSTRT